MDRRVKERLVGASILVALIVLIAPEMLSGPTPVPAGSAASTGAADPVRNVTVDLATAKAVTLDTEAAVAPSAVPSPPAPATQSGTVAADSVHDAGAKTAPPAVSVTGPAPALDTPPPTVPAIKAPKSPPSAHSWGVQLGSFASRPNADKLVRQLKAQGFSVYVLSGGTGRNARYRVRVGP